MRNSLRLVKIPLILCTSLFWTITTASALTVDDLTPQHSLKLLTQRAYLPGLPVLVRVEVRNASGKPDRDLWDAEATLNASGGVTLSTNRVLLRNGLGSVLVAFRGGGNFDLVATVGSLAATNLLITATNTSPVFIGGPLTSSNTVWSGVVIVTNDITVSNGFTLTILSNTMVLLDGVTSGTAANDLLISGTILSLGTEDQPVTITCNNTNMLFRWGQIRHNNAQASLYRYTTITRAGRAPGEGHTGTSPVLRPTGSTIRFENCNITDHAEVVRGATGFGTPGKIGMSSGSDLSFSDCLFQRARMGPEVGSTAFACTNTWIMDMRGSDDGDGVYVHSQSAGQLVNFIGCVVAAGDDDGIDTLGSTITVEDCIVRDWDNLLEDAKGISALNGAVHVRRSAIVNSTVGISAKSGAASPSPTPVLVTLNNCTLMGNQTNVLANRKSNAVGPNVHYNITNCVLWGGDPVHSDFEPGSSNSTNFTIVSCNLSEPYAGTGNIQSDPLFTNAAANDFHLLPFSPCIDAGSPASPLDPDGSSADIGQFPFVPPAPGLAVSSASNGETFQLLLSAYTNRNYVIEVSTELPLWNPMATNFQVTATTTVTSDGTAPRHFYRARLAP